MPNSVSRILYPKYGTLATRTVLENICLGQFFQVHNPARLPTCVIIDSRISFCGHLTVSISMVFSQNVTFSVSSYGRFESQNSYIYVGEVCNILYVWDKMCSRKLENVGDWLNYWWAICNIVTSITVVVAPLIGWTPRKLLLPMETSSIFWLNIHIAFDCLSQKMQCFLEQ